MKEGKALLIMSLIARRSSSWMHDVVTSRSVNRGEVSDDAMRRFAKDITDALAIIDEPELYQE